MTDPTQKYGVSAQFDFDNSSKWVSVPNVPLLDEHEMVGDDGRVIATVDRDKLQAIADSNNRMVMKEGRPPAIILGHTSDDPRVPTPPAKGFVVNHTVKPFRRSDDGRMLYALYGDYKVRPKNEHLIEEYPGRSVELYWNGGVNPDTPLIAAIAEPSERPLPFLIRNARGYIARVTLEKGRSPSRPNGLTHVPGNDSDEVIQLSVRGNRVVERYSILSNPIRRTRNPRPRPTPTPRTPVPTNNNRRRYERDCGPSTNGNGKPHRYAADAFDEGETGTNDFDPADGSDDGAFDDGPDGGGGGESPLVAELLQSKAWKQLTSQIAMLVEAVGGGPGGPGDFPGGPDGMGGPEMPPPGMGGAGMDAPPMGGGPGGPGTMPGAPGPNLSPEGNETNLPPDEADSRAEMGDRPVRMDAGMGGGGPTGFPGPSNTSIPQFGGKKRPIPMSRGAGMPGYNRRGTPAHDPNSQRIAALERDNRELRLRYARAEAEKIVNDLANVELIQFGRSSEEHTKGMQESVDYFTALLVNPDSDEDVKYELDVIRTRYARRRPNPANPTQPGLSRFARNPTPTRTGDGSADDTFEPVTDEEVCEWADLEYRGTSRADIVKYMRKKREQG